MMDLRFRLFLGGGQMLMRTHGGSLIWSEISSTDLACADHSGLTMTFGCTLVIWILGLNFFDMVGMQWIRSWETHAGWMPFEDFQNEAAWWVGVVFTWCVCVCVCDCVCAFLLVLDMFGTSTKGFGVAR